MSTLQEIEAAIRRLPENERLHLADTLLGSLPLPPAAHEPDEIIAEALRWDAELESGRVQPLSEEQFWARGAAPTWMTLEFHPAVQQDFNAAIGYYAAGGGGHLADRSEAELRDCLAVIKSGPRQYAFTKAAPRSGVFDSAVFLTLSSFATNWTS